MSFFPDSKTFLQIGNISIRYYAICIMVGALLAYYLSLRDTRKYKYPDSIMGDYFVYLMWIGILGARIWYCLFYDINYYLSNPLKILAIYEGGLAIHGGIIAGLIFTYFYTKRKNISFLRFTDCVLPNVLIAQAIGRWGNYFNQEAHGPEVSESYFDGILSFLKKGMNIDGKYYMPTFFYESVLNTIGFLIIRYILKRAKQRDGQLSFAYLMWYGLVRFFIETQRTDALMAGELKIAQIISILSIIVGTIGYLGFFNRFLKKRKPTILFDLDGTIIDSQKAIIDSFGRMYEARNRSDEFTREIQLSVLGPNLRDALKRLFPEEDVEKMLDEYHIYTNEILLKEVKPMKGAIDTLSALKEKGYQLGIVSSRSSKSMTSVLETLDMKKYFTDYIGSDEVVNDKPDPEGMIKLLDRSRMNRDEVYYVGDSPGDVKTGKAYGAKTIAYFFEEGRKEILLAENADYYIDDLSEVLDILQQEL